MHGYFECETLYKSFFRNCRTILDIYKTHRRPFYTAQRKCILGLTVLPVESAKMSLSCETHALSTHGTVFIFTFFVAQQSVNNAENIHSEIQKPQTQLTRNESEGEH